jgi:hypothetical protein
VRGGGRTEGIGNKQLTIKLICIYDFRGRRPLESVPLHAGVGVRGGIRYEADR